MPQRTARRAGRFLAIAAGAGRGRLGSNTSPPYTHWPCELHSPRTGDGWRQRSELAPAQGGIVGWTRRDSDETLWTGAVRMPRSIHVRPCMSDSAMPPPVVQDASLQYSAATRNRRPTQPHMRRQKACFAWSAHKLSLPGRLGPRRLSLETLFHNRGAISGRRIGCRRPVPSTGLASATWGPQTSRLSSCRTYTETVAAVVHASSPYVWRACAHPNCQSDRIWSDANILLPSNW